MYVFSIEDAWKEAVVVHVDATEKVVTVKLNGTQEVCSVIIMDLFFALCLCVHEREGEEGQHTGRGRMFVCA